MKHCAVKNCARNNRKNYEHTIKFFSFPKNKDIRKLWVKACGKQNVNSQTGRVCSLHFTDDDWRLKDRLLNNPISKRLLDPEAIPTQMLPDIDSPRTIERNKRFLKRSQKKIVEEAIRENDLIAKQQQYVEEAIEENDLIAKQQQYVEEAIEENDLIAKQQQFEIMYDENSVSTEENNSISIEIQTEAQLECAKDLEIIEMNNKMEIMKKENDKLKHEITKLRNFKNSVQHIFTEGQLDKLQNPNLKIHWSLDDISAAISFHSAGPRAYRYMYKRNFPLPSPSTLRQWAKKNNLKNIEDESNSDEYEIPDVEFIEIN